MAADVREDETNVDQSQYEVAAAEWSNVAEVTLARTSRGAEAEDGEAAPAECPVSPLVSVADITEHLRTQPGMVSCDWRRAGHVISILISHWSRRRRVQLCGVSAGLLSGRCDRQVSRDWWRAGHVTTILTSDWSTPGT